MFDNKSVLKSIARRVFPGMGPFSGERAKLGEWDVCLNDAWLTVLAGRDALFRIEARGGRVEATYALPAVMERANGEKEYGTAWANSRCWRVNGWADAPGVSRKIRGFFGNTDEFLEEEAKVYKIIEGSK